MYSFAVKIYHISHVFSVLVDHLCFHLVNINKIKFLAFVSVVSSCCLCIVYITKSKVETIINFSKTIAIVKQQNENKFYKTFYKDLSKKFRKCDA